MPSMFSPASLDAIIKRELPPGAHKAIVGIVDDEGAKVVVGLKLVDGTEILEVQAVAQFDWSDQEGHVGGRILYSW